MTRSTESHFPRSMNAFPSWLWYVSLEDCDILNVILLSSHYCVCPPLCSKCLPFNAYFHHFQRQSLFVAIYLWFIIFYYFAIEYYDKELFYNGKVEYILHFKSILQGIPEKNETWFCSIWSELQVWLQDRLRQKNCGKPQITGFIIVFHSYN